ncbi:MAG: hypothetical protein RIC52_07735, partial [Amphiplicatus sp.]
DISGTMWLVYLLFVYGLKSIWVSWLWPVFNQIFLMVFLSTWLRRSNAMTGAEWIVFRFGDGVGARLSHLIVVIFALVTVLSYLAYGFVGIGKFAATFLPFELATDPRMNEILYGLIIVGVTSIYVVKGGMLSVVATEVLQFFIMLVACVVVGVIAMNKVSPEMIAAATPEGWGDAFFGWRLDLDWSGLLEAANAKIIDDGWSLFSIFFMLMLFKGVMQSFAGPAPTYDMQRILSARTPREAAMMSGLVSLVLNPGRYLLIAGLTVLALVYFTPQLRAMGPDVDFELILPFALKNFVPAGLLGILIAGLLAAFMSSFAASVNAAPAYVVNDIYRRYINPNLEEKAYVRASIIVSALFIVAGTAIGLFVPSLNKLILWLVSALYGGYTAANMLKWYWWRFNGHGYFWGMAAGIAAALPLALTDISPLSAFPAMFAFTVFASVIGALATKPTEMPVLMAFYKQTRPWGFWGPVLRALEENGEAVAPNRDFARDMANVVIGIVWQTALVAAPIYLVIGDRTMMWTCVALALAGTVVLKFTWYDHLKDYPDEAPKSARSLRVASVKEAQT